MYGSSRLHIRISGIIIMKELKRVLKMSCATGQLIKQIIGIIAIGILLYMVLGQLDISVDIIAK